MKQSVLNLLPPDMQTSLATVPENGIEELRLRIGLSPTYSYNQTEIPFPRFSRLVCQNDFSYILNAATHSSVYAVHHEITRGFITVEGGHRIGLCGRVVMVNDQIQTITSFSSMSIRLASDHHGTAPQLHHSTLIAGPPGCGKTTLLRNCVRKISEESKQRVVVIDERGELAACQQGIPQYDLGCRTDILTDCPKHIAIPLAIRTMTPQWIAVDEITDAADVAALEQASYCGVRFLASAHIWERDDLKRRPVYRSLMAASVFQSAVLMSADHHWTQERL